MLPVRKVVTRSIRSKHYDDIKARYLAGESTVSIALLYGGKDHSTILYHLKKMGVWKRKPKVLAKKRGVDPDKVPGLPCNISGCARDARTRGLCASHYQQAWQQTLSQAAAIVVRCEHTNNRCECVNIGKRNYQAYLEESGSRRVQGDN